MRRTIEILVMSIILVFIACTGLACSTDGYSTKELDGYTQITVKNDLGSYSLEYPSHYRESIGEDTEFWVPYAYLHLDGPVANQTADVFDPDTGEIQTVVGQRGSSYINVEISNFTLGYGEVFTATAALERRLEGESTWKSFKLLERSPVTISGVEGELVVYLNNQLMPLPVEDENSLEYVCSVFFNHNELTWEITATSFESLQVQVRADFDHVISTFKLLK